MGSPPMNLARGTIESANGGLVVRAGSAELPIPDELARERKLEAWSGRPVVVGIRPEDLEGPRENGAAPGDVRLEVAIDRVEALGANLLGFFTVDAPPATSEAVAEATGGGLEEVALITREGTPFCATFEPRSAIRVGDRVEVTVDTRHLHFFDPETETALGA
jgi:multiple sugar transport system ATP-binding protein